jgi:hypothetical protein
VSLRAVVLALGNAAKRPVLNVLSGTHFAADVTLGMGEVRAATEELAKRHQANFRGWFGARKDAIDPQKAEEPTLFSCARPGDN